MNGEVPTPLAPGRRALIARRPGCLLFGPLFIIRHSSFVIPLLLLAAQHAGAATPPALYGVTTNLPPVSTALPDAGLSLVRVFGALALVLALFLGGVWLFKNWQRLALKRGGRQSHLEIVEMRALGNRHVLYVVGYQQQRLLLAASPAGVTLVSHLPPGDAPESLVPPPSVDPVANPNFLQSLQQAIQKRA